MGINLAVAGKGGTGKTTISALIIRNIIDKKKGTVLALDADPNSNLNELLGLEIKSTIGEIVEDFKKEGASLTSSTMYKDQQVEMNIHRSVMEGNSFDLLVMGRGEGPGCYCAANNLFKKYIDMLQDNYDYVVMDNEAGMEHLSRKTTHDINYLLIISDPTPRAILTAARLRDLSKELKINAREIFLVLNRVNGDLDSRILRIISENRFDILGIVNTDETIPDIELEGKTIFDLPGNSEALGQVGEILSKIGI